MISPINSLFCNGAGREIAAFPLMYNDVTLHYMALWSFVLGAALLWAVMHLKRNTRIRQTACDCDLLRSRIRNILQHSREVLFGFDLRSGRFDYLSPSCLSLTGYTVEEIEAMGSQELLQKLHPDDLEAVQRLIAQLKKKTN